MYKTFVMFALVFSASSCCVSSESKRCPASGVLYFDVPELDPVVLSGLSFYAERPGQIYEVRPTVNGDAARLSCNPGDIYTMVER